MGPIIGSNRIGNQSTNYVRGNSEPRETGPDVFEGSSSYQENARARLTYAGEKMFSASKNLEALRGLPAHQIVLSLKEEMTHTSNNPNLSHESKIFLLKVMKQVFKNNENLSLDEFRERLFVLLVEKAEHFIGFEHSKP